jgi:hypothetical protein
MTWTALSWLFNENVRKQNKKRFFAGPICFQKPWGGPDPSKTNFEWP